jgi:hypothetical protein
MDRWIAEGHLGPTEREAHKQIAEMCKFDPSGSYELWGLGWCEAEFSPFYESKILEDRGEYELVLDKHGRSVLFFKGRRNGFMPEYVDHPVKDMLSWEKNCKWRMDPKSPERADKYAKAIKAATTAAEAGKMITQMIVGGYMYLRSLIGPLELLYKFYDEPELIHDCMKTWFELAEDVTTRYQSAVTFDQVFIGEDICYNKGPLISPDMIREFLFPYYQQLLTNIRRRQLNRDTRMFFQVDTDGNAPAVIDLYRSIGMDVMSPFEVASGCDVVEIGRKYPDLVMSGGIDKRILASGRDAIDKHIDYIMPVMKKRGGYIPTCDHGVPVEVSFEDYIYFRTRLLEYSK